MYVSLSEIDLIQLLNLDKSMSFGETEIILDHLSKETYFRFLFEELPKLINKKDYDEISDRYKTGNDIDELMNELEDRFPGLHLEFRLQQISNTIKKEFTLNYLEELKNDYKDNNLLQSIDRLKQEIDKPQINLELCNKLKDEIGKKIYILNKNN